jgi:hypothetical protein
LRRAPTTEPAIGGLVDGWIIGLLNYSAAIAFWEGVPGTNPFIQQSKAQLLKHFGFIRV